MNIIISTTQVALCWSIVGVVVGLNAYRVKPKETPVLLDLNRVLVRRVWSPDWVDPDAKRVNQHNVYVRPGAQEFVKSLKQNWLGVGVWTAGRRDNVVPVIEAVFGDEKCSVLLTQDECTPIARVGTYPLYVKDLGKVASWDAILVDDSIDKVMMRDWSRAVIVEPWDVPDSPGTSFEEMRRLLLEHPVKKFFRNAYKSLKF